MLVVEDDLARRSDPGLQGDFAFVGDVCCAGQTRPFSRVGSAPSRT